ncbi:MAG: sdhB [Peptococcaceae bacterium]|jgi:L-serine dehydratase|nr:sdhB [Peptococcaceae bacterium]
MAKYMSCFDIIGPIMVGPSSSHTAGAVRLGKMARCLLGENPRKAEILLHGSFRETYRGHGTDLALIAGLLGLETDDTRIKESFRLAKEASLAFAFQPADLGDVHPNTVRFLLEGETGYRLEMQGSSTGGGNIVVTEINGFPVELYGNFETIITTHQDVPGVIAQVTQVLSCHGLNIAFMRVARKNKGKMASMMIETDQSIPREVLKEIKELPSMFSVRLVGKV